MSKRKQRSREGCWTCKERRRKCDGRRPFCINCATREVQCEGYDVRLQWGIGIASRGRYSGAEKPVADSIPSRPAGRRRDREREQSRKVVADQPYQVQHSEVTTSPMMVVDEHNIDDDGLDVTASSVLDLDINEVPDRVFEPEVPDEATDEQIFEQFLTSGIHVLHSTAVNDTEQMLAPRISMLCLESKALYAVCLSFQASLTDQYKPRFYEYFDAALSAFRMELDACVSYLDDATWVAGLLLCTVGCLHGLSWTIHLHGMYAILATHGFDDNCGPPDPFRAHLLEVMGVMDLSVFTVGRLTQSIGIWRRHCRGNLFCEYRSRDTIEHVSGLPRSLLDIFSRIGHGSEEQDFWDWPGLKGTFLQCQLWEAYRLAGMLILRQRLTSPVLSSVTSPTNSIGSTQTAAGARGRVFPSTEILVTRILSHVQAIMRVSEAQESATDELVVNAINMPTFVAGLEVSSINSNEDWKTFIVNCFTLPHLVKSHGVENRYLLELLQERWLQGDEALDVNELARVRGRELGLL